MGDELTERIIGAAIEVHRLLGPGLLETIYEEALSHEFDLRDIPFRRQVDVEVCYKGENNLWAAARPIGSERSRR